MADAELAIKHGFDGIIISNHGGRQLDSVPSSLDVLREIAPVAKGRILLAVDGGIRRGTDIFKALALGADFCMAGRPAIWGLSVGVPSRGILFRRRRSQAVVRLTNKPPFDSMMASTG